MIDSAINRISRIVIYPIIFAIFPFISLFSRNFWLVSISEFFIALLLVLLLLAILWWVIFRITGSIQKSALVVSVFFILFFSFGHVLPSIGGLLLKVGIDIRPILMYEITWKLYLLLGVWVLIFIGFIFLIRKVHSDLRITSTFMNVTSIGLLVLIIYQSTLELQDVRNSMKSIIRENIHSPDINLLESSQKNISSSDRLPNIYYIVLDGYGRSDILKKYYQQENQELLDFLIENGFFIANKSRSNYAHTVLSLASTLNMNYLEIDPLESLSNNPLPLIQLIKDSNLETYLSNQGYKTIAYETGYSATELYSADEYHSPGSYLTTFQAELINLTPLRIWLNEFLYDIHRQRILFVFDHIQTAVQTSQPTFVFAHIISPHPPFVFGPNGEPDHPDIEFSNRLWQVPVFSNPEESEMRYRNQVIYTNKLLQESIDRILSQHGKNVVIIVQGDHGPGSTFDMGSENIEKRTSILNAYYFPGQDYSDLYDEISPVNSFRLVLDQFMGTNFGLLEDNSFFSLMSTPYNFIEVD